MVWDHGVAGSNPVLPTEIYKSLQVVGLEGSFDFEVFLRVFTVFASPLNE
jgi:hypothetical protein